MLPEPSLLVSFDRDEFAKAFAWAMNAIAGAAQIADPASLGFDLEEENGAPMQLRFNDTPETRLGIAMRERYSTDAGRAQSAMFRIWALMDLLRSGRLTAWVRSTQDGSGGKEIAEAVVFAAAVVSFTRKYQFPVRDFLRTVREIESGREP